MLSPKIHCVQNVSYEGPGFIQDWSQSRGLNISKTLTHCGEIPTFPENYDWLILLGGDWDLSTQDSEKMARPIIQEIQKAVSQDKVVIGICLGSQLLAKALGGKVVKNPEIEIGWHDVSLNSRFLEHAHLRHFGSVFSAVHWHQNKSEVPKNCQIVASSEGCQNQAFFFSNKVYGFQFHPEWDQQIVNSISQAEEIPTGKYTTSRKELLDGDFASAKSRFSDFLDSLREA